MVEGGIRAPRLLIVESDRHSFDELRAAFAEESLECEVALDLETALSILDERRMDLAVVNAQLAEEEEEELIEKLHAKCPDMRLVLYEGTAERARRRRLRRMGADSYLTTASDLAAVARAAVRVLEENA